MSEANERESDLALARRAAEDERAFAELVEKYSALIYTVAFRCASVPSDAADIAQETFLKAWRSLPAFRGECALSTWLCRIAQSCACDFARVKKRQASVPLSAPGTDGEEVPIDIPVTDTAALPEEETVRQAEIAAVREAIASLPEEWRVIVTMRDLGGLSYHEIADTLGIELGTVKSRLFRARSAVKEFLIQRNFFPQQSSVMTKE